MTTTSDDVLNVLLWAGSKLMKPTFTNLEMSFDEWIHTGPLRQHCRRLEQRQWVERKGRARFELSTTGKRAALGGESLEASWKREWDGYWRLVLFDLPRNEPKLRSRLIRHLRGARFGFLQNSAWVSPFPTESIQINKDGQSVGCDFLVVLESRCIDGATNDEIVRRAWNFERINENYRKYMAFLEKSEARLSTGRMDFSEWLDWTREERLYWEAAIEKDPFLPEVLLPPDYLGNVAWHRRLELTRDD